MQLIKLYHTSRQFLTFDKVPIQDQKQYDKTQKPNNTWEPSTGTDTDFS